MHRVILSMPIALARFLEAAILTKSFNEIVQLGHPPFLPEWSPQSR